MNSLETFKCTLRAKENSIFICTIFTHFQAKEGIAQRKLSIAQASVITRLSLFLTWNKTIRSHRRRQRYPWHSRHLWDMPQDEETSQDQASSANIRLQRLLWNRNQGGPVFCSCQNPPLQDLPERVLHCSTISQTWWIHQKMAESQTNEDQFEPWKKKFYNPVISHTRINKNAHKRENCCNLCETWMRLWVVKEATFANDTCANETKIISCSSAYICTWDQKISNYIFYL